MTRRKNEWTDEKKEEWTNEMKEGRKKERKKKADQFPSLPSKSMQVFHLKIQNPTKRGKNNW